MLPFIVGGALAVWGVSKLLSSSEKSSASHYKHRLEKEYDDYSGALQRKQKKKDKKNVPSYLARSKQIRKN